MSEKSSEYLKRTCLICGCHTNQTINIYEPRSGPNIVQLIQAKFKFQPLNEDKYLCFSCNNWLINWHSLQALNSNDAESPSGTFRSHLNSGNVMQDEKSSGSKKQVVAVCRPIAQVKPRQLLEREQLLTAEQHDSTPPMQTEQNSSSETEDSSKPMSKINFNKRNFRLQLAKRAGARVQQKSMQQCSCGKYMVVRAAKTSLKIPTQTALKCRKCREFSRLKACYLRSIVQVERELSQREPPLFIARNPQNLVIETETVTEIETTENESQSIQQNRTQQLQQQQPPPPQQIRHQYLPKPTVDGKVVSMLRRLGTTLTREPQENGSNNSTLPQIMSPTKPKSKWLRPLEEDEVLVNFDTSISEVLPSLADQFTHVNSFTARKRLMFQVSETAEVIDLCEEEEDESVEELMEMEATTEVLTNTYNLPKGLTITLV
ncbi:protein phyllopod [Lucilia sericata]|uniref:protein phyllopod n=1 Tax=Lucilia sericata TaxID=13632 RepID=UPI0018A85C9B|nr:protein phyllopod [Lucilia sericata]